MPTNHLDFSVNLQLLSLSSVPSDSGAMRIGVVEVTVVAGVTVTRVTDITGVTNITEVTDITGVTDITRVKDITGGAVQHMAY